MNAPAWRRQLVPVGVIVAVGVLTFLPFAAGMGFYRDDWYMLWSAHARGPESIIELFSIDRPFMGYTYSLTYRLLGDSAIAWQLYATGLKIVGALAVYGIMRLLWPGDALPDWRRPCCSSSTRGSWDSRTPAQRPISFSASPQSSYRSCFQGGPCEPQGRGGAWC